ncbi:MAG: glycoside hydrolase family 9 protein [Planctomycetes bacterium]|nr:glycoside hydrolase family 9 protein [Planctomycetota bacterium]
MTCRYSLKFVAVLCLALAAPWAPAAARAADADLRLDGATIALDRPPLFAFLGWEKQVRGDAGGLHVRAPNGQGGAGYRLAADLSAFADHTPALALTPGAGHKGKALNLQVLDADGTRHDYAFRLAGLAAGASATVTAEDGASLREPGTVGDAGKQPGLDLAKIVQIVLVGDWSEEPFDLTVRQLAWVPADAAILKAREALRARLAAEAEARRKADEAKAARKRELLAGAPHPADGPDIRHVALVAPDVLALQIQEKEFVPAPQVPYEPRPGDEIRHVGKDKVLVVEDGKVQDLPLEVVVVRKEGGKETTLGHLAVSAGRLKPEDQVRGQALADETVDDPEAYRIAGVDDPAWKDAVAPAAVWWKRKPNAYRSLAFQVDVFLKLPRPLAEGKVYRIECRGVNTRQAAVEYRHEPTKVRSPAVHVSAIGFRPDDPFKRAYLSTWLGTGGAARFADGLRFRLLDDATGRAVFEGPVRRLSAADAKETFKDGRNYEKTDVLAMDFGAFKAPGRYRVCVDGIGCSYPFPIADDAWAQAFRLSMKGLLHQRSGIALGPPVTDYVRPRDMHPADGAKVYASEGSEMEGGGQDGLFRMLAARRTDRLRPDAWGGHMDAGDWDRNSAHPAAMWNLVDLYELFPDRIAAVRLALPPAEAGNAIPDVLDEVLWNLDLYRRLQHSDGGVGGGIESTAHPRPGEASWQESLFLSVYAPDPRASFIYAATAAKLSRALDASDRALAGAYAASARKAWDWAAAHTAGFLARLGEKARRPMADDLRDVRNLAAFELWRRTGEAAFHDEFRATTLLAVEGGEILRQRKAAVSYARLPDGQGDAALRATARQWLIKAADDSLAFADGNALGITVCVPQLPPMGFVGYFATPETSVGPVLPYAWLLTHEEKYLAGMVRACQFAAGANPDNRALTTGLGPDPVRFPLHIDSWVTGQPAPAGITVYGISDPAENYGFDGWAHTWFLQKMVPGSRTWPAAESYWDIWVVPSTNEFTIHQTMIPTAFYWGFLAARP